MGRRFAALVGALSVAVAGQCLASLDAAAAVVPDRRSPVDGASSNDTGADPGVDHALSRLRSDTRRTLRVRRGPEGRVDFVSAAGGHAMVGAKGASTPARAAAGQLARYGRAFGIDGAASRGVVQRTLPAAGGGSVVRVGQVVDGVPVFGGQVVMSLDEDQGLVSAASATTDATQVPAAVVGEARARSSALSAVAKIHRVPASSLSVSSGGRQLYDPALVHAYDPMGARPVWRFEVTNGADIRETVLIGTGRGEIALHFNDAPGVNRRVCDNHGVRSTTDSLSEVPICPAAARSEGGPSSSVADVNAAYTNLGEAAQAYQDLDGLDLTALIGSAPLGESAKSLQSTVRWCFADDDCPYGNAFWDGRQMVFGTGYAGADDVVGHELTHGYVDRTSHLFALHQSGAINESLADTIGEIVDHRNGGDDDSAWLLGERVPGGAIRSMRDPAAHGQPDRMTSDLYVPADALEDDGAVHDNDGVGNKTAYLISQGGTFNGRTLSGIDAGDAGLAKTGRLYLETIPRLTSGADYAQLGDVLSSTCQQLAATGTGGFSSSDCAAVSAAIAATELSTPPVDATAAAPKAAVRCPAGRPLTLLKRDDDDRRDFGFALGPLWQRTPANQTPVYAQSGASSLFGWDPDPMEYDEPHTGSATTAGFTVPRAASTYFNFHHAYLFEFDETHYYDGGEVIVQRLVAGRWTTVTGLPWVNGARRTRAGTSTKVFGGDSHGYGSSQVDLTSLAGQTVRVVFRIAGDDDGSYLGWFVDDVRLYACASSLPSAPATTVAAGTTSARVSWTAPTSSGSSPIASYRITRSGGRVSTAPASARSFTLTGLRANTDLTVTVAAVTRDGQVGPAGSATIQATSATVRSSVARPRKRAWFTVTGTVTRRGVSTRVAGMKVTLQRHLRGQRGWRTVGSGPTSAAGTRSWRVRQSRPTYYRVVATGLHTWLGTVSATRGIGVR